MGIFDIPSEILLLIYSELLVLSEPIVFESYNESTLRTFQRLPPLYWDKRDDLCPALLRINKKIYSEASPLLYSKNCFQFPKVYRFATEIAQIAPFLHQIGSQASHIRHICIPFPTFDYPMPNGARLHKSHIKNLHLVRDSCTSIRVLELLVSPGCVNYALSDWPVAAAEALDLLNSQFKSIPSLKEIVINFELYPHQDPGDDLTKKMNGYGWSIKVTKLPEKEWYSADDRHGFDEEADCEEYDHELSIIEERKIWTQQEDEWVEEYYKEQTRILLEE